MIGMVYYLCMTMREKDLLTKMHTFLFVILAQIFLNEPDS